MGCKLSCSATRMIAGRPLNIGALADKLDRHGITASAARNIARRTLAANLPATILADLADINISTAVQWTRQAKTDWTTYRADRASDAQLERESPADRLNLGAYSGGAKTRPDVQRRSDVEQRHVSLRLWLVWSVESPIV